MAEDSDWLDIGEPEGDWLEAEALEAPRSTMPYDRVRFQCMRGTGRVWACDGEYVAYRPHNHALDKEVNPRTAERHQNFLASGHYEHVGTYDEVQIFRLLEGSPFKRIDNSVLVGVNMYQDMRSAAKAAVMRDWVLYNDILEELAGRIKGAFDTNQAKLVYEDVLSQILNQIQMRGGPTLPEVEAGLHHVRVKRGVAKHRVIMLPQSMRAQ